jgi:hypothetical protein
MIRPMDSLLRHRAGAALPVAAGQLTASNAASWRADSSSAPERRLAAVCVLQFREPP